MTFSSLNKTSPLSFLNTAPEMTINLEKVTLVDSAGLSLMVEWIKQSKQYQSNLKFKNTPHQLLTLAKLSDFAIKDYLLS